MKHGSQWTKEARLHSKEFFSRKGCFIRKCPTIILPYTSIKLPGISAWAVLLLLKHLLPSKAYTWDIINLQNEALLPLCFQSSFYQSDTGTGAAETCTWQSFGKTCLILRSRRKLTSKKSVFVPVCSRLNLNIPKFFFRAPGSPQSPQPINPA